MLASGTKCVAVMMVLGWGGGRALARFCAVVMEKKPGKTESEGCEQVVVHVPSVDAQAL